MLEREKTEVIVREFTEAKKLLHAMFGKKIRYILLTDHVTDFTTPVRMNTGEQRYDIYLTSMRLADGKKLNIIGGAIHEAAHVVYSRDFANPKDLEVLAHKINLVEDIFVNHKMSLKYRGAASLINDTYDVRDPMNPSDPWEALMSLNQTLLPLAGINWDYIDSFLPRLKSAIQEWLDKCLATDTYKQRVPYHKELLEKFSEEAGQSAMPNDVFGAISMLLGGGITHQCSGISTKQADSHESIVTSVINGQLKSAQDTIEKQEEAKSKGFTPVDYIDIVMAEPDMRTATMQLKLRFEKVAYKKTLEKSSYDHRMLLSGSLSKKKIHNFGYVTHGLIRPMFKRREYGDIANFFILLDGSGSMQEYENKAKEITSSLAAALNERYSVIGAVFQDRYLHVSEGGIPKVSFGGGTPALAAVNAAIENMKKMKGERYLIFISDFEFNDDKPDVPNKIKFIKVSTTGFSHSWDYHCILDELEAKIGVLIANA